MAGHLAGDAVRQHRVGRLVWAAAISVCLFRVYVGAHLPLDVVGGIALGWAAGAAAHLLLGAPEGHVSLKRVRRALEQLGFTPLTIALVRQPSRRSASFQVTQSAGPDLFVKIASRERRDDDLLYRAWRILGRRWAGRAHTGSAVVQVEHEAGLSAMAAGAGVRTPSVVFAGAFGNGGGILIQRWVPGVALDDMEAPVDEALLRGIHRQVDMLDGAGIVHGDLHASSVLVDETMQPWLVDFSRAEAGADTESRSSDAAPTNHARGTRPHPRKPGARRGSPSGTALLGKR